MLVGNFISMLLKIILFTMVNLDFSDRRFLLLLINLTDRYSGQFLSCNPSYVSFDTLNSVFSATGNQFGLITCNVLAYFPITYPAAQFCKRCNLF